MKIVYSDTKSGKTAQAEIDKEKIGMLIGRKMDEIIEGSIISLDGYKLKITGLSDKTGSPSRREIEGTIKSRPMLASGTGIRNAKHGFRAKRMVRGNTIGQDTEQVNTVIIEYGAKPVEELFKPKDKKE
jgi:small subunit ribosomal protein S6e